MSRLPVTPRRKMCFAAIVLPLILSASIGCAFPINDDNQSTTENSTSISTLNGNGTLSTPIINNNETAEVNATTPPPTMSSSSPSPPPTHLDATTNATIETTTMLSTLDNVTTSDSATAPSSMTATSPITGENDTTTANTNMTSTTLVPPSVNTTAHVGNDTTTLPVTGSFTTTTDSNVTASSTFLSTTSSTTADNATTTIVTTSNTTTVTMTTNTTATMTTSSPTDTSAGPTSHNTTASSTTAGFNATANVNTTMTTSLTQNGTVPTTAVSTASDGRTFGTVNATVNTTASDDPTTPVIQSTTMTSTEPLTWETEGLGFFVWFSDFHLDPYYGTELAANGEACRSSDAPQLGRIGCDSPVALVQQTLNASARIFSESYGEAGPDFLVVTGDFSRHHSADMPTAKQAVEDALRNVSSWIDAAFPLVTRLHSPSIESHAVYAIGNNDVVPDYNIPLEPNNSMLDMIAEAWDHELTADEKQMLKEGGFMIKQVQTGLYIISLNTLYYSVHLSEDAGKDPMGQFAWLASQLDVLRQHNARAYIVGHIPPALGSYQFDANWKPQYVASFIQIVNDNADVVRALLFGHLHTNEFRAFGGDLGCSVPMLLTASVSPIYDNNPGFRVVKYDLETKDILDLDSFRLDLSSGPEKNAAFTLLQRFSIAYPEVSPSSVHDLEQLALKMMDDHELFNKYSSAAKTSASDFVHSSIDCGPSVCPTKISCVIRSATHQQFVDCVNGPATTTVTKSTTAAATTPTVTSLGPASPTSAAVSTATTPTAPHVSSSKLAGWIAGGLIGGVVLCMALFALLYYATSRRRFGHRQLLLENDDFDDEFETSSGMSLGLLQDSDFGDEDL